MWGLGFFFRPLNRFETSSVGRDCKKITMFCSEDRLFGRSRRLRLRDLIYRVAHLVLLHLTDSAFSNLSAMV